ncbi:hypothetical protein GCM10009564_06870 [Streptomyces thermogriseus]|uniref:Uncharacterized protein n=1 Tax=Streptomyces thermogriseus TaxID=75292 RepID=A0ABN1STG6_9ACTN
MRTSMAMVAGSCREEVSFGSGARWESPKLSALGERRGSRPCGGRGRQQMALFSLHRSTCRRATSSMPGA